MKKTYLVTVDIDTDACKDLEKGPLLAIAASLAKNRFVSNPVVRLAPDSFQPTISPDVEVRYNGQRLGLDVVFTNAVSPYPSNEGIKSELPQSLRNLRVIVFDSERAAYLVLERMQEAIRDCKNVTVAALKEMIDESTTFIDYKWGWTDLSSVRIQRMGPEFTILLPDPKLV